MKVRNYFATPKRAGAHAGGGAVVPIFNPHTRPSRTLTHRVLGWRVETDAGAELGHITVSDAARLQGFDGEMEWCGAPTEQARQIADAVPLPLADAILRSLTQR